MKKFEFVDVTIPKQERVVMENKWWVCKDGDEKQALFYNKHPQCNPHQVTIEWLIQKETYDELNVKAVFIPTAFVYNPLNEE